jgi:hypothetical protein
MLDGSVRSSATVKAIGAELRDALKLRQQLGEDANDPALLLDMIEGETNLAEACALVLEQTHEDEILIEGLDAKIKELQTRKGRMEKSIESRRGIILMAMDKAGLQTIRSPLGTMTARPTPPKVTIMDEVRIPSKFWKPSDPKLDRAAVAEALKAGEAVPGATLSNGGLTLSVRIK